jgi:hypothetical protein
MWVEGSELLHDVGGDGCEREGLQAACGTTHVAGLQEEMDSGRKRAVRGRRRVATLSADAVVAIAGERMFFRLGCI